MGAAHVSQSLGVPDRPSSSDPNTQLRFPLGRRDLTRFCCPDVYLEERKDGRRPASSVASRALYLRNAANQKESALGGFAASHLFPIVSYGVATRWVECPLFLDMLSLRDGCSGLYGVATRGFDFTLLVS